jgi:hypothetical protein
MAGPGQAANLSRSAIRTLRNLCDNLSAKSRETGTLLDCEKPAAFFHGLHDWPRIQRVKLYRAYNLTNDIVSLKQTIGCALNLSQHASVAEYSNIGARFGPQTDGWETFVAMFERETIRTLARQTLAVQ